MPPPAPVPVDPEDMSGVLDDIWCSDIADPADPAEDSGLDSSPPQRRGPLGLQDTIECVDELLLAFEAECAGSAALALPLRELGVKLAQSALGHCFRRWRLFATRDFPDEMQASLKKFKLKRIPRVLVDRLWAHNVIT